MKAYKSFLLLFLGALSSVTAAALYVWILTFRYPMLASGLQGATGKTWGLLIGIPACIGVVTGLLFPFWQRMVGIANRLVRTVLLWIVTMSVAVVIGLGWLVLKTGKPTIFFELLSLDRGLILLAAVLAGIFFHLLRMLTGETHEAEASVGRKLKTTIEFRPDATQTAHGIALITDLQGFSAFFNQPWAQAYVPDYLDMVLKAVSTVLLGGEKFWSDHETLEPLLHPVHQKFLGDGVLYLWTPPAGKDDFSNEFVAQLTNRLWFLKNEFPAINKACTGHIPSSFKLPPKIRFGLARGRIYELTRKDSSEKEYMGFCINLASRLQSYCNDLGFIASANLNISQATLDRIGFIKVVATKIKGFQRETVIIDRCEYENLKAATKSELFEKFN